VQSAPGEGQHAISWPAGRLPMFRGVRSSAQRRGRGLQVRQPRRQGRLADAFLTLGEGDDPSHLPLGPDACHGTLVVKRKALPCVSVTYDPREASTAMPERANCYCPNTQLEIVCGRAGCQASSDNMFNDTNSAPFSVIGSGLGTCGGPMKCTLGGRKVRTVGQRLNGLPFSEWHNVANAQGKSIVSI
jgi:hypothetical protein